MNKKINNNRKNNNITKARRQIIDNRFNNNNSNINLNIGNFHTRNFITNYIKNNVNMDIFKYKLLNYEEELYLLQKKDYYVSPNYVGTPSLCVFTKVRDDFYSVIVEKKKITNAKGSVFMTKICIDTDESIYNGTIFDGVFNTSPNGNIKFMINDVYYLAGSKYVNNNLLNKMNIVEKYVKKYLKKNNSIEFYVNRPYKINYISELVQHCLNSKFNNGFKITGLAFNPSVSSEKLLYLFNNSAKKLTDEDNEDKIDDDSIKLLDNAKKMAKIRAKKCPSPDVYNMSMGIKIKKNGKKIMKYKHIGFAYIPTVEISKMCQDIFNGDNMYAVLNCKYDDNKKRWIPIEKSNDKYPNYYKEYYN